MNVQPGTFIGPYRVESLIGRGGMSEVYKVWHEGLQRYEALKILPEPMSSDTHFVRRFLDNERMAASLHHPNIVTIYAVGRPDSPPYYFSMELVEGGDLAEMLGRRGRLALIEALPLLHQIAAALDYAHSHNVVHRDIKPANVLLERRDPQITQSLPSDALATPWDAKVVDFGIARAIGESGMTRFTQTGMFVGTPEYMSPEQAGSGHEVDHRTDLYALGIIAYEMLCGRPPFRAAQDTSPLAVIVKHLHDEPPSPRDFAPHLSEATCAVLLQALAKDPTQRLASGAAFVDALAATAEGALAGASRTPSVAGEATENGSSDNISGGRPKPPRRSHTTLLILALVLGVLLVGLGWWWRVNPIIVLEDDASGVPSLAISQLGKSGELRAGRKIVVEGRARNLSGEPTARLWRETKGKTQYWSQGQWRSGELPATAIENSVSYQKRTHSWAWTLPSLEPGEYHLRVTAKNAEGVKNSEEISFNIAAAAPTVTPATSATATPVATATPRPLPAAVLTIEKPSSGGSYLASQLKQTQGSAREITKPPTIQLWRETSDGIIKSFELNNQTQQRRFTSVAGVKSFYSTSTGRWQANLPTLAADLYLLTISGKGRNGHAAEAQRMFRIFLPTPKPPKIVEEPSGDNNSRRSQRETSVPRSTVRRSSRTHRSTRPAVKRSPAKRSAVKRSAVPRPSVPRPSVPELPRPD
jgi:serine/threonine protein kinase